MRTVTIVAIVFSISLGCAPPAPSPMKVETTNLKSPDGEYKVEWRPCRVWGFEGTEIDLSKTMTKLRDRDNLLLTEAPFEIARDAEGDFILMTITLDGEFLDRQRRIFRGGPHGRQCGFRANVQRGIRVADHSRERQGQ